MKTLPMMPRRNRFRTMTCIHALLGIALWLSSSSSQIFADIYHHNNILIGDRALGLGGSYAGISDDSSGVYYNPAGIAFSQANDISGSANAFYWREANYKDAIGDQDFKEESAGSVPSFFGGLQKLDSIVKGLTFAFGVFTTDSEQKDQNDLIQNYRSIVRFHRTIQLTTSTNHFTGGLGYRVNNNLSVGFGINFIQISELRQEYQDVIQPNGPLNEGDAVDDYYRFTQINTRRNLTGSAIQPVFGVQYAFGRFSFGLSYKHGIILGSEEEIDEETRITIVPKDVASTLVNSSQAAQGTAIIQHTDITGRKDEDPLGGHPSFTRFGFAWFASPRLMIAADLQHASAVKDVDDKHQDIYNRESVLNYSAGAEFYITPSFPARMAYFTNNDARPDVEEGKVNQADHIDYQGSALFVGYVQTNSQISVGAIFQVGDGKAQKIGNSPTIQEVEAYSRTFAFSATHNF